MRDLIKNPLRHRSFYLRLGFAFSFALLLLAFRWAPAYEAGNPAEGKMDDEAFRIEMKNVKIKREEPEAKNQRETQKNADLRLADLHIDRNAFEYKDEKNTGKERQADDPLIALDSNLWSNLGSLDTLEAPPLDYAGQMPSFPGGLTALYAYIRSKVRYPSRERELGIEGTVYLKFVVGRNGQVSDVRVLKGPSRGLNEEAMRCVKEMPRWSPGRQNGRRVSVYYMLPIEFVLD